MAISKFQGGYKGSVYVCRKCRKRTRETGEGESASRLCLDCYEWAGYENTHSDNDHESKPVPKSCPVCFAEGGN